MQKRGTAWVLGQTILLAGIVLVPSRIEGLPVLADSLVALATILGPILVIAGLVVLGLGSLNLGPNMTVFPRPRENGTLVQTGIYGLVRHPIYSGLLLTTLGWSIYRASLPSLLLTLVLGILLDRKAYQEELWLQEKYPEYAVYRTRVHKLIPWVY